MNKDNGEKKSSSTAAPIKLDSYFTLIDERNLLTNTVPVTGFANALKYLSRAVVQEPKNLRLHTQRIFLLLRQTHKNKAVLASAIADLFIVLKESGAALKARILEMSQAHLHARDWAYLKNHEQCGLTPDTAADQGSNCFSHSLLSHGLIGRTDLIKRTESNTGQVIQTFELHEQALMCLEYGQLDVALDLLQQARADDPNNSKVNEDLLSIYMSLEMNAEYDILSQELRVKHDK